MNIFKIDRVNAFGEGVSNDVHIPFTLAGETVRTEDIYHKKEKKYSRLAEVITPSSERVNAPCPHYTLCGGCRLQHYSSSSYKDFKTQLVRQSLQEHSVDVETCHDPIFLGPGLRRRVDFKAQKIENDVVMGFNQFHRRKQINVQVCPVVVPDIEAILTPLRHLFNEILREKEEVHIFITKADNGLDILIAGFKRSLDDVHKDRLRCFAQDHQVTRLKIKKKKSYETLICQEPPFVRFAGIPVPIEANSFLQASSVADTLIADTLLKHIPAGVSRVADLFCGRGTITLPLVKAGYQVEGFEGDKRGIELLNRFLFPNLKAYHRDLFADPLSVDELNTYEAVILDPPRTGIKHQTSALLNSHISTLLYVSCSPKSFAEDAKILSHNYRLKDVIPLDQFVWSHHIEVIGVFQRA